jgi:two-component system LytT family response regulator
MGTDPLRAIIVDDEVLGRRAVRQQLERHPDVRVLAQCATGAEAARAIATLDPDVVFLDIQMPGGSGFDVVQEIGAGGRPAIIFVTAFDEHAVRAFEVNAVDYLLKPLDPARFDEALRRVRSRLAAGTPGDAGERMAAALRALADARAASPRPRPRSVPVREGDRIVLVRIDEIDWVEAAGNHLHVYAAHGRRRIVTRATLQGFAELLNDPRFLRVHRSAVVNADAVVEVESAGRGMYVLSLRGGGRVETSYHYRSAVSALIGAGGGSA